jgi:hypothetical protein
MLRIPMSRNSKTEVDVEVLRVSQAALLVTDGDQEVWIPFSLIDDDSDITAESEAGDSGTLIIPEWKAEEAGLI